MGVLLDDWSFVYTAKHLAETGRLTYNGWGEMILGFQAYWAALWIKIFGFSFAVCRASLLPMVLGVVPLLYLAFRRIGITRCPAVLGTLLIVLSPVFLAVSASFLTDVTGLFWALLSLFLFDKARRGASPPAVGALLVAVLTGLIGGSVRQVVWLAPLIGLAYGVLSSGNSLTRRWYISLLVFSLAAMATMQFTFMQQPYTAQGRYVLSEVKPLHLFTPLLMLGSFLLPLLCGAPFLREPLRLLRGPQRILVAVLALAATGAGLYLMRGGFPADSGNATRFWLGNRFLFPSGSRGDIVTQWGLSAIHMSCIGERPVVLPLAVRGAFSIVLWFILLTLLLWLFRTIAPSPHKFAEQAKTQLSSFPPLLIMLLAFTVTNYTLMVPRMAQGFFYDRYNLLLAPGLVALILWYCQHSFALQGKESGLCRGWLVSFGLVGVVGLWGIAAIHDDFAQMRARATAARTLMESGVPRSAILAGTEFDAWTQLEATGYMNNPIVGKVRHAAPLRPSHPLTVELSYSFWQSTPDVIPHYFVTLTPQSGLVDTNFPRFPYQTVFSPHGREVHIQQVPNR